MYVSHDVGLVVFRVNAKITSKCTRIAGLAIFVCSGWRPLPELPDQRKLRLRLLLSLEWIIIGP